METFVAHVQQVLGPIERLLGHEAVPWLVLLTILVARPPALREILRLRQAWQGSRYRHLRNLTQFRTALVKRDSDKSAARRAFSRGGPS